MSGLFKSSQKSSSQSESRPWFPTYASDALKRATELGMEYADTPYTPYGDTRFADFSPDELQAFDLARSLVGAYQPDMNFSSQALRDVTRQGLGGIDQSLIDAYANPFTSMVMDQRRARSFEDFERAKSDLAAQKGNIGAFGGSRLGLQESNLFDEFQQRLGDEEAEMLMNRYDRAISGAQEGLLRGQQGAVDTANLTSMRQGMGLQDVTSLSGIGGQQRALEQAGLDFNYEEWLRSQMDPLTRAQGLLSVAQPVGALTRGESGWSSAKQSSTPSVMDMIGQTIGMATGLGGMGSSLFGGGGGLSTGPMTTYGYGAFGGGYSPLQNGGGINWYPQMQSATTQRLAKGGLVHSYNEGGLASLIEKVKEFDRAFSGGINRARREGIIDPLSEAYEGVTGGLGDAIGEIIASGRNVGDSVQGDIRGLQNKLDYAQLVAPSVLDGLSAMGSDFLDSLEPRELDPAKDTRLDAFVEGAKGIAGLPVEGLGHVYKGVYDFFNTPLAEIERQKQEKRDNKKSELALMQGLAGVDQQQQGIERGRVLTQDPIEYFTNIPMSVKGGQDVSSGGGELTSQRQQQAVGIRGTSGYDDILGQIRGSVPQEQRKKSVFEDPLFNWGLALVTGRDPVSAYGGMAGESRKEEMQPITKEDAIRKMALEQLQSENYGRQVDAQLANVKTPEERKAALDLVRSQIAANQAKSYGGGNGAAILKSFRDLAKQIPGPTLRNPTLRRNALEEIGKNLAIQYNMTEDEVLSTLQQLNQ